MLPFTNTLQAKETTLVEAPLHNKSTVGSSIISSTVSSWASCRFGNWDQLWAERVVVLPTPTHTMLLCRRDLGRTFSLWASLVLFQCLLGSALDTHWYPATATWYGSPEGDGSDGNGFTFPLPYVACFMFFFAFTSVFVFFFFSTRWVDSACQSFLAQWVSSAS